MGATALRSSRPAPAISSSTPTPSRARADDYSIPAGAQANTGLDSDGYSLGGSYVFRDGFVGVAYSSFDSTYFIPGIEAAERQEPHRAQPDQMDQQGRMARQRFRARGRPLLVRRHRLQARRGGFAAGPVHRLDLPQTTVRGAHGGAAPARHGRLWACCAAPSACSGPIATCRPPAPTASCWTRRARKALPASCSRSCS